MKLTKKSIKKEVETTETVCEITQAEFEKLCAETAAATVVAAIGDTPGVTDVMAGIAITSVMADFVSNLAEKLFNDTNENPDKKEEK